MGNVWEFVPYNDASTVVRATLPFRQHAKHLADQMISATCENARKEIKNKIVEWYAMHHGTTAPEKNLISLFVYGGPLFKPKRLELGRLSHRFHPELLLHDIRRHLSSSPFYHHPQDITHAILYTGDGFLKKPEQLSQMLGYFGTGRREQPKVVQVTHHGSRSSWHQGVADALAPTFSIFCAYKEGLYYHPHEDVWDDFEVYGRWICGAETYECFRLYQELMI